MKVADIALVYAKWQYRLGNVASAYVAVCWIIQKKNCFYDIFHEAVLRQGAWRDDLPAADVAHLHKQVNGMVGREDAPFLQSLKERMRFN